MAKQNGNGTTETNTTATKEPSIIDKLHDEWKSAGSKAPSASQSKDDVKAYLNAKKAKEAAKAAYERAQKAESDTVSTLIRHHGKGKMKIAGEVLLPMTRGTTVFLRGEGTGEVKDLGG